jgi:hypothetical protein
MQISIVIADGYKQVMMTPENDHEKEAIKFIAPDDILIAVAKKGTFDNEESHFGSNVGMCKGGYLRRFAVAESLMFVIKKKKK